MLPKFIGINLIGFLGIFIGLIMLISFFQTPQEFPVFQIILYISLIIAGFGVLQRLRWSRILFLGICGIFLVLASINLYSFHPNPYSSVFPEILCSSGHIKGCFYWADDWPGVLLSFMPVFPILYLCNKKIRDQFR